MRSYQRTLAHFSHTGTRERHLESLLQQSLRQLILVKNFPRCVVQIVLQVTEAPTNEYVNTKLVQASSVRGLKSSPAPPPLVSLARAA